MVCLQRTGKNVHMLTQAYYNFKTYFEQSLFIVFTFRSRILTFFIRHFTCFENYFPEKSLEIGIYGRFTAKWKIMQ